MQLNLTDRERDLLLDALNDAIRDARQEHSIYGTNTTDRVEALKALRSKVDFRPTEVPVEERLFAHTFCTGGIGDTMRTEVGLTMADVSSTHRVRLAALSVGAVHRVCGHYNYYTRTH